MKYLVDTHILLWALFDSKQLSDKLKDRLRKSECCISIASLWEIAIKNSSGKLKLEQSIQDIADLCKRHHIDIIEISPKHCDFMSPNSTLSRIYIRGEENKENSPETINKHIYSRR